MNSNSKKSGADAQEINMKILIFKIKDEVGYFFTQWRIILGIVLLGALTGLTYSYFKKPLYVATCRFVLEDEGGGGGAGLGQYAGLASMVGLDIGGGGGIFQGDNILELYKSRMMLQKTLLTPVVCNGKRILLIDRYIDFNNFRSKWEDKPALKNISFATNKPFNRIQDSLVTLFINDINKESLIVNKPDKKLSILEVQVKTTDEFFSKSFNNMIVKNVNDFYIQTKTTKSIQNLKVLQHQTDSVRAILTNSIYKNATVMDATPNLNPNRILLRAPGQNSQMNAEANKAILSELIKNLELAKISLRKETPLIAIIDNPIYPLEKIKVSKVLSAFYGITVSLMLTLTFLYLRRKALLNV